ncbi:MAG: alpha/beta hydrolase [Anaerolineae bacterium]|nr:alpha/beta hydrolase [Anaerolineae bacterium]
MALEKERIAEDVLIDVGGCRLHFSVIQGSETRIVLEVGGGADASQWGTFPMTIAQETGATVVTYDRAGFGKSDLPDTPYDMVEEVDWFMEGLRQLGLDQEIILIGHSYGGWLIRLTASRYPEIVRGMVFIDPFSAEFVDLLGVAYLDNHPSCRKDLPFANANPEDLTKNQRGGIRMVKEGLGPKVAVMRHTTIPKVPVRVITSGQPWWQTPEEDRAWRQAHEQIAASIPGADLIVAQESDHLIPDKQPEIILEAIKQVIRLSKPV